MAVVMTFTMLAEPASVMAAAKTGTSEKVTYVNSDGEEIDASVEEDFVYEKVNSDGEEVAKIYGYLGSKTDINVPETLGGVKVASFAIDPRWPVDEERYEQIRSISLPVSIQSAHAKFMNYFTGLEQISIADGNDTYTSRDGVLYKHYVYVYREYDDDEEEYIVKHEEQCKVAAYPRAKKDTAYVMPEDMTAFYKFFYGCPVQSITISPKIDWIRSNHVRKLENLKEIKVAAGNPIFYAKDGVLFEKEEDYNWEDVYNNETGEWEQKKVYYKCTYLRVYPCAKSEKTYTVPADVTRIGYDAFYGVNDLEEIVIPKNVERVDFDAFSNCRGLKTIRFTAKEAPAEKQYENFWGVRDAYRESKGAIKIEYPEDGQGYEGFMAWINGKNVNCWSDYGIEEDEDEIPLGANLRYFAYADYGEETAYPVFSKDKDGEYSRETPDTTGTWYVKFIIDETDKYFGLETPPGKFTVVDPAPGQAENDWIRWPGQVWATAGEDFTMRAVPLYGTARYVYKPHDAEDSEKNWTENKPTEPGVYDYKAIVDETDAYEGLIFISKDHNVYVEIDKPSRDVCVRCDDIPVGGRPNATVSFYEGSEYDDVDLSKLVVKYYSEDEGDDSVDWVYKEVTSFDTPGEYVARVEYEDEDKVVEGSCWFSVLTKVNYAKAMIEEIPSLKRITGEDEEKILKARSAYDSLSTAEKRALSEDITDALEEAEARIAYIKAKAAFDAAQDSLHAAQGAMETAKAAYDKSKEEADKAAATPGQNAVDKAAQAWNAADEYKKAADKVKKEAETAAVLAKKLEDAAEDDPVITRRDVQDAEAAAGNADSEKKKAAAAAEDAANIADSAKKAVTDAYNKALKAAGSLKVKGLKAKAQKKSKATVSWTANKSASGYQIQYSLKKNFKGAKKLTVKKASQKTATIKKLKAGKKYYIRIRTLTKVKDPLTGKTKTKYGKWSGSKNIKANK